MKYLNIFESNFYKDLQAESIPKVLLASYATYHSVKYLNWKYKNYK